MTLRTQFFNQLVSAELVASPVKLDVPAQQVPSWDPGELAQAERAANLDLKALRPLFNQVRWIEILWELSAHDPENERPFKEDPWLKKNFLEEGYDWGVVKEYLSGFINIQKLSQLFNKSYCSQQGYYYTLQYHTKESPDDYFPLDICWDLTACVKRENGVLLDRVWLVHTNGEALYDMGIGIEQYLDLAYKAKGFHYWQLSYLFPKGDYHELMKRYLPKILPHIELDLSDFGING